MLNPRKIIFIFLFLMLIMNLYSLEFDSQDIINYFNINIPQMIDENKLVGVVVSVVNKDEIIFSRGYGYADIENKKVVDPGKTLFRAGSISKLFTWTAIMQLAEQGKIDLDENVNTYLKEYKIPDTFDEPITIKHLLSHTPGFEDNPIGLFTKKASELKSLHDFIKEDMTKRIRPSGKEIAYSNYGASLAGFIVENISGVPFEKYIENNIFKPLKMKNSTFYQPVPYNFTDNLAEGYMLVNEKPVVQDFEFIQGVPAGSMSTTADDMARYLMVHLNGGVLDGTKILNSETMEKMHSTLFVPDINSDGFAYGLIKRNLNGINVLGHDGDTIYFHSNFAFFPEKNLGVFLSTNTNTGMLPLHYFFEDFMNEFFPAPIGNELAIKNTRPLTDYIGQYVANRRSESNFSKLFSLFMKFNVKLSADGNGLDILNFFTQKYDKYVEIDERTFQKADGTDRFVFLEDDNNKINSVIYNNLPVITFIRPPVIESLLLLLIITGLAIIMIISGIIARPTGLMALFSKKHKYTGPEKLISLAGSALILFYLIFVISLAASMSGDVIFEIPNPIPNIILGITFFINIVNIPCCILAWKNKYWKLPSRIYYTYIIIVSSVFLLLLYYWKILFPG